MDTKCGKLSSYSQINDYGYEDIKIDIGCFNNVAFFFLHFLHYDGGRGNIMKFILLEKRNMEGKTAQC